MFADVLQRELLEEGPPTCIVNPDGEVIYALEQPEWRLVLLDQAALAVLGVVVALLSIPVMAFAFGSKEAYLYLAGVLPAMAIGRGLGRSGRVWRNLAVAALPMASVCPSMMIFSCGCRRRISAASCSAFCAASLSSAEPTTKALPVRLIDMAEVWSTPNMRRGLRVRVPSA